MSTRIDLNRLKQTYPLPTLLKILGMERYAKSSCPSPFRQDQKASWGIFQYGGRWMYKDFATGEVGDEIGLLAKIHRLDPHNDFLALLKIYRDVVSGRTVAKTQSTKATEAHVQKPDGRAFGPGSEEQLRKLSELRGISLAGLEFAQSRGVLIFGHWFDNEVYGVTDQSGRLIELRRLDGNAFAAWRSLSERKSHAVKGSQKDWPLGILEGNSCEYIALAEGLPDFLALHQYVVQEDAIERVSPVGLMSSATGISPEALNLFKGKHVRIYPHMDEAGIEAAARWQRQLLEAGASKVDFFNFAAFHSAQGSCVKDLCEFNQLQLAGTNSTEGRILP